MKKSGLFFFLFIFCYSMGGATITLFNDAPFVLTATIQSSISPFGPGGQPLGKVVLNPQQKKVWTGSDSFKGQMKEKAFVPGPPYTVVWVCPNGGIYSVNYNVTPGAFISAKLGVGDHSCPMKKADAKP